MDHDDAVRCQAAERYVAGELPPDETDAFEEHFFDCQECAEEVRWEQIFLANARAVARELAASPPVPTFSETVRAWFAAHSILALSLAANVALLALCVYIGTMTTRQPGPGARMLAVYFAPPLAKGADSAQALPAGTEAFIARFTPEQSYPSYFYQVLSGSGDLELSGTVQAVTREVDQLLQVPVQRLRAGVHKLEIRDKPGGGILAQFEFSTSR